MFGSFSFEFVRKKRDKQGYSAQHDTRFTFHVRPAHGEHTQHCAAAELRSTTKVSRASESGRTIATVPEHGGRVLPRQRLDGLGNELRKVDVGQLLPVLLYLVLQKMKEELHGCLLRVVRRPLQRLVWRRSENLHHRLASAHTHTPTQAITLSRRNSNARAYRREMDFQVVIQDEGGSFEFRKDVIPQKL